jgi:hypothetical protein
VFEHNWADGQNGIAILFTVRNQDARRRGPSCRM